MSFIALAGVSGSIAEETCEGGHCNYFENFEIARKPEVKQISVFNATWDDFDRYSVTHDI